MLNENIDFCIEYLKNINDINGKIHLSKLDTFRALMNITMPVNLNEEYYKKQDLVLQKIKSESVIIDVNDLLPMTNKIYLYQGDITKVSADAIVNACNSKLLGCFQPLHSCIDNAIHSFAGLQVRRDLMKIMKEQGEDESSGKAKITNAYNLPSKYILHTVGPIVSGIPTKEDELDLYNCYISCLKLADSYRLKSIVFCSISTGIYGFPIKKASKVAVKAVKEYLKKENNNIEKVIFDVFSKEDYDVYYRTIKEMD